MNGETLLFWRKFHFDNFMGFASGGFPFPVTDSVRRSLREHGMSAFDLNRPHASVGSDQRIHFDDALESHAPGQRRIFRCGPLQQSARGHRLLRAYGA